MKGILYVPIRLLFTLGFFCSSTVLTGQSLPIQKEQSLFREGKIYHIEDSLKAFLHTLDTMSRRNEQYLNLNSYKKDYHELLIRMYLAQDKKEDAWKEIETLKHLFPYYSVPESEKPRSQYRTMVESIQVFSRLNLGTHVSFAYPLIYTRERFPVDENNTASDNGSYDNTREIPTTLLENVSIGMLIELPLSKRPIQFRRWSLSLEPEFTNFSFVFSDRLNAETEDEQRISYRENLQYISLRSTILREFKGKHITPFAKVGATIATPISAKANILNDFQTSIDLDKEVEKLNVKEIRNQVKLSLNASIGTNIRIDRNGVSLLGSTLAHLRFEAFGELGITNLTNPSNRLALNQLPNEFNIIPDDIVLHSIGFRMTFYGAFVQPKKWNP